LRQFWIYSNIIFWTLIFGVSSLITILVSGKKELFKFFGIIWAKTLSFIFNVNLVTKGEDYLLKDCNYIFAANHTSFIDIPLLLLATKRYTVFVAKNELKNIPIFRSILDNAGFIFVDRNNNEKAISSMNNLISNIKLIPRSVAVFPEGTRSRNGKLQEFKKGATILGLNTKLPIIPVAISGGFEWSKKRLLDFSSSEIIIEFGKPINTKNFFYKDREDLTNLIKNDIKKMISI